MKSLLTTLATLLAVALGPTVRADEISPNALIYAPPPSPLELGERIDNARMMRTTGLVLAGLGAAMAVGSTVMALVAFSHGLPIDCGAEPDCATYGNLFLASTGLAVTSSVLMSVGIPVAAVGGDRLKRAERLKVSLAGGAGGGRVGVGWSF
jgi:hypothetical protein